MLSKLTLPALLESTFTTHSNRTALALAKDYKLTYSALQEKVESIIHFLKNEGINKGDKVAILGENHPHWGIAFFAITSFGAVAVPIMVDFSPVEVEHILRHSESKAIFVSAKYAVKLEEVTIDELKFVILLDDFSILPNNFKKDFIKKVIQDGKKEVEKIKFAALKFFGLASDTVNEDDPASLIYTSGTTGHSKGVLLSHRNVVSNAVAVAQMVGIHKDDVMLSILPLSHTMECTLGLITPAIVGASVYYLDKPPTAASLLPALETVKPTIMLSVPLIIEKIYRMRILPQFRKNLIIKSLYATPLIKAKLNKIAGKKLMKTFGGRLRMFCIGGAGLAEDVEKFLRSAGFPYSVGYGLTETSPLATGNPPDSFVYRSVGQPIPGVQVKIDNPDPISGEGEVLIKGPNVMIEYFKSPEKTKEVFTEDGWFRTGDLGLFDKKGYLYIKGRIKNIILGSNGKNIYPEEIEQKINESQYVVESLVLEMNGKLAARIHLDYKTLDEVFTASRLNETEIKNEIKKIFDSILAEVNSKVPTYAKINSIVEQLEPFEKTPTQKVKRFLYVG